MRRILLYLFLNAFSGNVLLAQDIPLFSQKLTNSFIFNPALAGHTFGSLTYSFKQNYSGVEGAPQNHFLSIHTPIAGHRFGIGANIYQEDVTFLRNTYASAAFAYHVALSKLTTLSFGLSGEYNSIATNGALNFTIDPTKSDVDYDNLQRGGVKDYDFSFGVHFQNRFLKAGLAANRLATTWLKDSSKAVLSNYYSVFGQGLIPLRGGDDLLEPYIAYRKLSEVNSTLDFGLYYTYNNKLTVGASMRSGNVVSGTLGFKLTKYVMLGYSREMIMGNVGGFVGAANEFTLRLDFNDQSYKERFSSDYKSSLAYRKKTLSGPLGKSGARSPKQLQRKQKKLAPYSPNRRYQNIKKLSVKTKGSKKNSFSVKKRQKSNHKKKSRRR
ncbi:MAG: PorP/SprF family type IX secretion system membrane protein [Bacteroidota bacterium]